jgi:hypothetical protein
VVFVEMVKSFIFYGELAGIRTQDPRLKRALLYQLSYELSHFAVQALVYQPFALAPNHCEIRQCPDSALF